MRYLSLFSGIGGLDLAAESQGWEPVAFVEREPFCQRVLAARWPGIEIISDVHTVDAATIARLTALHGPFNLVGGFPCPGNSTAGKRRGRDDERNWNTVLALTEMTAR